MPRKSIYLFLLSACLCSLFFGKTVFFILLGLSLLTILFLHRGIFYTIKANKLLSNKEREKGYNLLRRAYLTDTVPYMVVSGYIFISLKYGHYDNAWEAINKLLNGNTHIKMKPRFKKETLSHKALYYWATGDIEECLVIMNDLYNNGFNNSNFYGSYGCILTLNKEYEKAEKVIKEAIDFNSNDKISLDNEIALYIEMERWEEAKDKWNYLEDLYPNFPEFWYHGALIENHFNNNDKSRELLDKAKELPIFHLSTISEEDLIQLESKL